MDSRKIPDKFTKEIKIPDKDMKEKKMSEKDIEERKMSVKDIEENLQELLDKESREERKANGRLVAVIVASFVIFLAIYHAWIRKTTVLAGILVPALIMILYGGWVVVLAKRDKKKRQMFEKKIEEIARQEKADKAELGETQKKSISKTNTTQLTNKDEKQPHEEEKPSTSRKKERSDKSDPANKSHTKSKKTIKTSSPHRKKIKSNRPSIRQKLLRQNAVIETPNAKIVITCKEERKKHPFLRTASAP